MNSKQFKLLQYAKASIAKSDIETALELLNMATAADVDLPAKLKEASNVFFKRLKGASQSPTSVDTFRKLVATVSDTLNLMSYYDNVEKGVDSKVKDVKNLLSSKFAGYMPKETPEKPVEEIEEVVEVEEPDAESSIEVSADDGEMFIVNEPDVFTTLTKWHSGQNSAMYSLFSSSNAGKAVPKDVVENTIDELEADIKWLEGKPAEQSEEDNIDLGELEDAIRYLKELID